MKNGIMCFLSVLFICVFVGVSLDGDTYEVYAAENVAEEFSISTQDDQEILNGQKVTKGKKLVLKVIGISDNKENHKEKNTYNFYYTVPGDSKRIYIAKNVESAYIWNTYDIEKIGELEIHMTINKHTESVMEECLCNKMVKLNMVNVYEITYLSNYKESNLYAMKFYCEDKKSISIKGSLFEREGYYFDGWNDKPDGSGTDYKIGKEYFLNKNLNLYAVWKQQKTVKKPTNMKKAQTSKSMVTSNITDIIGSARKFVSNSPVSVYTNDNKKNKKNTKNNEKTYISVKPELTASANENNLQKVYPTKNEETDIVTDKPLNSKDMATEQVTSIDANKASISTKKDENANNDEDSTESKRVVVAIIVFVVVISGAYIYRRYNKKQL